MIKKVKRNVDDYGWVFTVRTGVGRLFRPIYDRKIYRIYRIKIYKEMPRQSENSAFEFKMLEKWDKELIRQVESMAEWLQGELVSRISCHQLCFVALNRQRVAAFNLVALNDVFISWISLTKKVKKGEAWSEQISVHKDFRNRSLASELRCHVIDELRKMGIKRFYGGTLTSNEPALRLARRVGFKEIVDVQYCKVGKFIRRRYRRISK